MRYIQLIHFDTKAFDAMPLAFRQEVDRRALAKNAELVERGVLVHAEALQGPDTAVLVRVRDGQVSVTDGPYMETKEQLAGFVLVDVVDMAAAVGIAGEDPLGEIGVTIEVRPVYEIPTPP
jgi:hypothetical protein